MTLEITLTHKGYFYKAWLNGERISEDRVYEIIGNPTPGFRLEHTIDRFKKTNTVYELKVWEQDVS